MISSRRHFELLRRLTTEHDRERQAWERERKDLLDRVMFLSGRSWDLPPDAAPREPEAALDDLEWAADQLLEEEVAP